MLYYQGMAIETLQILRENLLQVSLDMENQIRSGKGNFKGVLKVKILEWVQWQRTSSDSETTSVQIKERNGFFRSLEMEVGLSIKNRDLDNQSFALLQAEILRMYMSPGRKTVLDITKFCRGLNIGFELRFDKCFKMERNAFQWKFITRNEFRSVLQNIERPAVGTSKV